LHSFSLANRILKAQDAAAYLHHRRELRLQSFQGATMSTLRYEPWALLNRLQRESAWTPAVDVHEEPERYTVRADLPGVEAKDIHVTADDGLLTIRGERHIEKREEHKGFERLERAEGAFLRRFTLPEKVRTEEIKARHNNGVLEIVIPKQPLPEVRRVEVQVN
jgi:HSP20 family protein